MFSWNTVVPFFAVHRQCSSFLLAHPMSDCLKTYPFLFDRFNGEPFSFFFFHWVPNLKILKRNVFSSKFFLSQQFACDMDLSSIDESYLKKKSNQSLASLIPPLSFFYCFRVTNHISSDLSQNDGQKTMGKTNPCEIRFRFFFGTQLRVGKY